MTSFFPHRVSQCPIIVNNWQLSDFYCKRFTDIVLKLGIVPTNGKIALQRQTVHADAVAGLHCLVYKQNCWASVVDWLQTFLTVLNFHPSSG